MGGWGEVGVRVRGGCRAMQRRERMIFVLTADLAKDVCEPDPADWSCHWNSLLSLRADGEREKQPGASSLPRVENKRLAWQRS